MHTAEAVVAATRSDRVADVLLAVHGPEAARMAMQPKLWLFREAFDALIDELVEQLEGG